MTGSVKGTMPSLWELETFFARQDVIIAGSGFAGLWSAYFIKKLRPGFKVSLIDKNISPSGASTRNAGFACFGSVTELIADAKALGIQKMLETFTMRFEGIRAIRDTFDDQAIDYEAYGGYELVTDRQYPDVQDLERDITWLNELLFTACSEKNLFRLADEKIASFGFSRITHLIENNLEGQLHPGKLLEALTNTLLQSGVSILRGIELISYESEGNSVRLQTNAPVPFLTRNLLICTNILAAGHLVPALSTIPARGQVLVTSPIEDLPFSGSFHFDEGYYYLRNIGQRVLLGGARNLAFQEEETDNPGISEIIQQELERFLQEIILPGRQYTIDHRWSGIMSMAAGKTPVVKKLDEGCYCAAGLGGIGVAIAPLIGQAAARLLLQDQPA